MNNKAIKLNNKTINVKNKGRTNYLINIKQLRWDINEGGDRSKNT